MNRPTCDVCGLPATTAGGICGAELCDDAECFGVAWDRAFNLGGGSNTVV